MAYEAAVACNLKKFQCLFDWKKHLPESYDNDKVLVSVKDKLLTPASDWEAIVYNLVIAYESFVIEDDETALSCLRECENIIQAAECFGSCSVITRNMVSVKHVVYASWANCIARHHTEDEYKDHLQDIKKYSSMNNRQKAGVRGIQAACLMQYGDQGFEEAHDFIQSSIKNNPHEAQWQYLFALMLRYKRLRKQEDESLPSPLELSCLQKACDLDKEVPVYQLVLAYSLHDSVKKDKGPSATRDRATLLYRTAAEKWPNSAYVNLMAASGLMEYAYPVRDTKLADTLLGKAVELAPDSCHVHLVAGIFFLWPCKNKQSGESHLRKAKRRYKNLVREILNGAIKNYRDALRRALWEIDITSVEEIVYIL